MPMPPDYDGSTPLDRPRREAFCQAYVFTTYGNGAKAARTAGYSENQDVSATEGNRLLRIAEIDKRIKHLQQQRWASLRLTDEELLFRVNALVRTDPKRLFREDGSVRPPSEWDDEVGPMIAGFEVDEIDGPNGPIGVVKKLKLRDNHAAIRTVMQVRKMLGAEGSVEVNVTLADRMERAKKRLGK